MKNRVSNWIIGIGCNDHQYRIGGVTYIVSSRFEPTESKSSLKDRLERTIVSDFTPLTLTASQDKISDEYVCSAAGEEA
ncbi:MAG: hypothetical protein ACOX45_10345 [Acutalibacteraceae bacterium]